MEHPNLKNYVIIFSKSANRFLETLEKKNKQHVVKKIKELKTNSKNLDIKKA